MKKLLSLLAVVLTLTLLPWALFISADTTTITTAEQLAAITDGNYKLGADITVSNWTSIKSFSGTLDGDGHTIKGLDAPLFEEVSGTVKNLTVDGNVSTELTADYEAVALVAVYASNGASFENVTITGSLTVTEANAKSVSVGALVGRVTISAEEDLVTVTGCTNKAAISVTNIGKNGIGGFIGQVGQERSVVDKPNGTFKISQCVNEANITVNNGKSDTAGIIGRNPDDGGIITEIVECANTGDVVVDPATGEFSSGIIGYIRNGVISKCYNTGNIVSNTQAECGILGYSNLNSNDSRSLTIEYCFNASPEALDVSANSAEIARINNPTDNNLVAQNNYILADRTAYAGSMASIGTDGNQYTAVADKAAIAAALKDVDGYALDSEGNLVLAFQVKADTPDTPDTPDKPDDTPNTPDTPDKPDDTPDTPDTPVDPPKTGDALVLAVMAAFVAAAGVALTVKKRKAVK